MRVIAGDMFWGQAGHPSGPPNCSSAWQEDGGEVAVASLGAQGSTRRTLEDLGTWSGPSVLVRQCFKVEIVIRTAWLSTQLIVLGLASPLSPTDIHAVFRDKAGGARLTTGLGLVGCLGAAVACVQLRGEEQGLVLRPRCMASVVTLCGAGGACPGWDTGGSGPVPGDCRAGVTPNPE